MGQKIVLALGATLGLGVLLVIGNTIRLAIQSRRDEIIVVKLVGGTNAYVRRPFLQWCITWLIWCIARIDYALFQSVVD